MSVPPKKPPQRLAVTLIKAGTGFKVLPANVVTGNMFTLKNSTAFSVVFRIDPAHHPFGRQSLLQEIAAGGSLKRKVFWSKPGRVEFPYQVAVIPKARPGTQTLAGRKWAKGNSDPRIIIDR